MVFVTLPMGSGTVLYFGWGRGGDQPDGVGVKLTEHAINFLMSQWTSLMVGGSNKKGRVVLKLLCKKMGSKFFGGLHKKSRRHHIFFI